MSDSSHHRTPSQAQKWWQFTDLFYVHKITVKKKKEELFTRLFTSRKHSRQLPVFPGVDIPVSDCAVLRETVKKKKKNYLQTLHAATY